MPSSRLAKSLKNAKVNLIFYFLTLLLSFFSRKIFLRCLGDDFMGLVGTLQNLLGFLNLAELGVGTAIGFVLYQPLFEQNHLRINEIITVLGYLYRKIGMIIILGGLVLAVFLPLIFEKTPFELAGIYFAYFTFLFSSVLGYFVNYKQLLLNADQRNYVITAYSQSANILKLALQILLTYYTKNYYLWIITEFVFSIIYSGILSWKIKEVYPWLQTMRKEGKALLDRHRKIRIYIKQIFVHRIAAFVQGQTASVLIYSFVSLQMVAYYGNYIIIINKANLLINNLFGGLGAGIGSLIAENDSLKIKKVYWELMAFKYLIAGILVFSLYHLINPFISLWLGNKYLLSQSILILILVNLFISQTRSVNDMFINGYGLFSDVWAPVTEAAISIAISLIGGHFWGIKGVLTGPVISLFLIIGIWKPYFLYSRGFKIRLIGYWLTIFKYLLIIIVSWIMAYFVISFVCLNPYKSFMMWVIYGGILTIVYSLINFLLFYMGDQGMRSFSVRMKREIMNRWL